MSVRCCAERSRGNRPANNCKPVTYEMKPFKVVHRVKMSGTSEPFRKPSPGQPGYYTALAGEIPRAPSKPKSKGTSKGKLSAPRPRRRPRASYDIAFKRHVVSIALQKPPNNRIKPTCTLFPGVEPCQRLPLDDRGGSDPP